VRYGYDATRAGKSERRVYGSIDTCHGRALYIRPVAGDFVACRIRYLVDNPIAHASVSVKHHPV
jgi:hypothetical protein